MTEPRSYLLAWRLEDKKVLVVGGGAIGTAKIETLLGTGAKILVTDPTPSSRVQDLAVRGQVRLRQRRFRPMDLAGCSLVVAATGVSATNRRIRRWARLAKVVVNAVDDPAQCDVTVPAVLNRGPVSIAITTGGATPAGARFLREELTQAIEAVVPPRAADVFTTAANLRDELKHEGRYRYDYRVWREHLFEPGLSRAARGGSLDDVVQRFLVHFASASDPRVGRVILVGAGPGGADLITVRGADALRNADCVVYDRLADPALLDLAPVAAERIPVGKGRGHGVGQDDINGLMIDQARRGNTVVRLKGGDPFVFGRGGEEVDALREAGIEVEVVPGVSSALAAASLAGIPVTDRRSASAFTVMTGHAACRRPQDELPNSSSGTLVVLMAVATAAELAARLQQRGWPGSTGVAFVHAAGTPQQRQCRMTLDEVEVDGCPFASPTVMLVGGTVDAQRDAVSPALAHVPR